MKRATFVFVGLVAGCLAYSAGCGGSPKAPSQTDPAVKDFPKMGHAMQKSPEFKLLQMKTPQEKAAYLQELGKDPDFDPKLHTEMLEKYSRDADADVASAAKELLDKAK